MWRGRIGILLLLLLPLRVWCCGRGAANTADAVDTADAVVGAGADAAETTPSDLVLASSAKRRCSLIVPCHLHCS